MRLAGLVFADEDVDTARCSKVETVEGSKSLEVDSLNHESGLFCVVVR